MVNTRLKNSEKYKDGFKPKLVEKELRRRFHNQFVFVSDMGDLFGEWVPSEWIIEVIGAVKQSPDSTFLFLTKNPRRYRELSFETREKTAVDTRSADSDSEFHRGKQAVGLHNQRRVHTGRDKV